MGFVTPEYDRIDLAAKVSEHIDGPVCVFSGSKTEYSCRFERFEAGVRQELFHFICDEHLRSEADEDDADVGWVEEPNDEAGIVRSMRVDGDAPADPFDDPYGHIDERAREIGVDGIPNRWPVRILATKIMLGWTNIPPEWLRDMKLLYRGDSPLIG